MPEQVTTFQPDWVSLPGDTTADLLDEKGWTQAEFALGLALNAVCTSKKHPKFSRLKMNTET